MTLEDEHTEAVEAFESSFVEDLAQLVDYQCLLSSFGVADLQLEVPPVPFETLRGVEAGERSAVIRARVVAARERQRVRFEGEAGVFDR